MTAEWFWFLAAVLGWVLCYEQRRRRKQAERRLAAVLKGQAVALLDAFHLGRIEGRATPAQRDAALRQLWEGTSS